MGPQLYRCGNWRRPWLPYTQIPSFNGAATLSLRKPPAYHLGAYPFGGLQWGRNFIVAETSCLPSRGLSIRRASMGPQLYRCGNQPPTHGKSAKAAALQWGRNFIVAETSRPPMGNQQRQQRFNGAATLSLRKLRGSGVDLTSFLCFNGAATLSLRKPPLCPCRLDGWSCFNGAATLSLRKLPAYTAPYRDRYASMGPQLYRCGNFLPTLLRIVIDMLQWGRNFIVAETYQYPDGEGGVMSASMGPQLYRCGNEGRHRECPLGVPELQWGRNFIVAET